MLSAQTTYWEQTTPLHLKDSLKMENKFKGKAIEPDCSCEEIFNEKKFLD
jgi:hypothetical protein